MKILVAGDLHATFQGAKALREVVAKHAPAEVWQVGDLGYWPGMPGNVDFFRILASVDAPIYFADGNHENHLALQHDAEAEYELAPNVFHVPRGCVRQVGNLRVMFFGGARSVDRTYRRPGISWFQQELPNAREWARAFDNVPVEVIVAHDVPTVVDFGYPAHGSLANPWPPEDTKVSELFRSELDELVGESGVYTWFGGHHHVRKTFFDFPADFRVEVLRHDGLPGCFVLFDTATWEVVTVE